TWLFRSLVARVVQVDLDLARVARVDNPRGVQHGQAVLVGESGAGADHAHVARRDGYVNPGADELSAAWWDVGGVEGVQVEARVQIGRASGGGGSLIAREQS